MLAHTEYDVRIVYYFDALDLAVYTGYIGGILQ